LHGPTIPPATLSRSASEISFALSGFGRTIRLADRCDLSFFRVSESLMFSLFMTDILAHFPYLWQCHASAFIQAVAPCTESGEVDVAAAIQC
jgi:hypothetical protein